LIDQFAIIIRGEVVCRQSVSDVQRAGMTLEDVYFQFAGRPPVGNLTWLGSH
jgi:hypothetical protein